MKIVHIVGARPQFIKMATVIRAIDKYDRLAKLKLNSIIAHTGQHYDENMSEIFFRQLNIPKPDYNLGIGSASHGSQTAEMIERIEKVLIKERPDLVLLYGDTNSTLAGAIATSKIKYYDRGRMERPSIAHIEAGLRSYNKSMPEEINRVLTDHLSDLLFCPTETAVKNLKREGITEGVYNVGDVMYDSILYNFRLVKNKSAILKNLKLISKKYYLVTIHREENTVNINRLKEILKAISSLNLPVIFPVHPRTQKIISRFKLKIDNVKLLPPISYMDMLILEKYASIILTDSGGVQKEAYFLKVPCITLRDKTEWTETVNLGWNIVTEVDRNKILESIYKIHRIPKRYTKNLYGDGKSAERIVKIISKKLR